MSEEELRAKFNIPDSVKCCVSCHDDEDMGERDVVFEYEGKAYSCCCNVKRYIKETLGIKEQYIFEVKP